MKTYKITLRERKCVPACTHFHTSPLERFLSSWYFSHSILSPSSTLRSHRWFCACFCDLAFFSHEDTSCLSSGWELGLWFLGDCGLTAEPFRLQPRVTWRQLLCEPCADCVCGHLLGSRCVYLHCCADHREPQDMSHTPSDENSGTVALISHCPVLRGGFLGPPTQDPDSTISFNYLGSCYLVYKEMLGSPFPGAPSSLTAVLCKSELLASENEPPASIDGRELEPRIKCCWSPGDWGKHLFTSRITLQGLVGGPWIQSGSCPRASPHFWSKLSTH